MRSIKLVCVSLAISLICVSVGKASVLTNRLTFDGPQHTGQPVPFQGGGEDKLQDDSITAYVDVGPAGFSLGDIFYGIVNTTNTVSSPLFLSNGASQLEQITIVFSAQLTGLGTGSGGSNQFGPIANAANPLDLRNLLNASIINDFTTGPNNSSIGVVMSNDTGTAEVGGVNPLNLNAQSVGGSTITTAITNANGWFGDAVIGMIAGGPNFFEFLGSLALGGTERGGFTVQETVGFPVGTTFLPVDLLNFAAVASNHHVTLDTGEVTIANAGELARGWAFRDQSSYFVNAFVAVPEPLSVLVWGGLASIGGLMASRRRD